MTWQAGAWIVGAWLAGSWQGVDTPVVEPTPVVAAQAGRGVGSTNNGIGGVGHVRTEYGWIKATKYGVTGASANPLTVSSRRVVDVGKVTGTAETRNISVSSISKTYGSICKTTAMTYACAGSAVGDAHVTQVEFGAQAKVGSVTWVSADELLIILETMT